MVSGRILYRLLAFKNKNHGSAAQGFLCGKSSDLVFDTKLPVVPQYEHIFDDEENVQRLPSAVRESGMRVQLFDGALQQTRRILESDYKAAIPQYYNHSIQLLIPICLQNPGIPDLALAV